MNIEVKNKFDNYLRLKADMESLFKEYDEIDNKGGVLFTFVGNPLTENLKFVSRFAKRSDLYPILADYLFKRNIVVNYFNVSKLNDCSVIFRFSDKAPMFKIEFND